MQKKYLNPPPKPKLEWNKIEKNKLEFFNYEKNYTP